MGDVSAEPSMEDILSSIKRIIAEEGDDRSAKPRRGSMRAVPSPVVSIQDEVLELSDPMPPAPSVPRGVPADDDAGPTTIVSEHTAQAARGALDSLSRLLVKPEGTSDGTLEGLVRDLLRPMLREWLDANLPTLVETLVAREIAKITGSAPG